jgi:hypothetical protein
MTIVYDELNRPQFLLYVYEATHLTVYRIMDLDGNLIARHVIIS